MIQFEHQQKSSIPKMCHTFDSSHTPFRDKIHVIEIPQGEKIILRDERGSSVCDLRAFS